MRYKGVVSYDGTRYGGWQIQPDSDSIQANLNKALSKICNEEIFVTGAGRTDGGVHAYGQVFHFDTAKTFEDFKKSINSQLPDDIHVTSVEKVNDDFHARYDALWKHYCYQINMGEYDPVNYNHQYQLNKKMDVKTMKEVAQLFIGEHDFTSFNATKKEEMPNQVREIYDITFSVKDDILSVDIYGNGFLRHMVRMMVGTMIEAGLGKLNVSDVKEMLESCSKTAVRYNAPACGLYLINVGYTPF